jgi:hypothetical protein
MEDFIEENLNGKNMFDNIGGYIFTSNISVTTPTIQQITKSEPIPISNICFPKNTLINTDQGKIPIEKINPKFNTIYNKNIFAITKTISTEKYLVCFDKDSICLNYPNSKTIMSKDHKLFYKGKFLEAYKFLGYFKNVYKVEYDGEILYNVLMYEYDKMNVNNLICETLHPNNIISKLYTTNFGKEYKNKLVVMMNDSILKNDDTTYKKIVGRIC